MAFIYVNNHGNGFGYVDNPNPIQGDTITLYADPDPGESLLDILATDSHGYSIALYVQPQQTFQYNQDWGDVTIDCYFTGSTPPTPAFPVWLLFKIKENNNG